MSSMPLTGRGGAWMGAAGKTVLGGGMEAATGGDEADDDAPPAFEGRREASGVAS
jgi:hypothetical protein